MKKLIFIFAAFGLFACSDDDNDNANGIQNPYTGEVHGDWRTTAAGFDDMAYSLDCDAEVQFEGNYYYRFNTDGSLDVYHNCDVDGVIDTEEPFTTGTYLTTGNVLTLNIMGQEGKAHMIDIGENSLLLWFDIGSEGLFYNHDIVIEQQD